MQPIHIIQELGKNRDVFQSFLEHCKEAQYTWKPDPDKWCLLEIVCHLYDEEREDFRARTKHVLETPSKAMTSINPTAWVEERSYMKQDFDQKVKKFLEERQKSIEWLRSLKDPEWDHTYDHPQLGAMSATLLLTNWLAHDYLHFRQITRLKYQYLREFSGEPLSYAGDW